MDPKIWGPPAWFFLHTMMLNYPYKPSIQQKNDLKFFLINLGGVLPCPICRIHYKNHLQKFPIDNAIESKDSAFKWLVDVHNSVNRQLGKSEMSIDNAYLKYRGHYGMENDHQYTNNKPLNLWLILILVIVLGLTKYFWSDIVLNYKKLYNKKFYS